MLGLAALVVVTTAAWADDKDKDKNRAAKISPQLAAQIGAMFEKLDKNKDVFLDKEELAKAFRGPNAKAPPEPKADDEKKGTKPNPPQGPFPDQDFLKAWDRDADGKISLGEFEFWGAKYDQDMKKGQANKGRPQNPWQQYWQQWQKQQQQQQQQEKKKQDK
jgi:hypothetical protein